MANKSSGIAEFDAVSKDSAKRRRVYEAEAMRILGTWSGAALKATFFKGGEKADWMKAQLLESLKVDWLPTLRTAQLEDFVNEQREVWDDELKVWQHDFGWLERAMQNGDE